MHILARCFIAGHAGSVDSRHSAPDDADVPHSNRHTGRQTCSHIHISQYHAHFARMFHCRTCRKCRFPALSMDAEMTLPDVYKCAARYHSSVMSTPQIPSDWALSKTHAASEFVASQCFANIHNLPPVPIPPIDLITYMACCQLSRVLSQAYLNPSQSPKFSP